MTTSNNTDKNAKALNGQRFPLDRINFLLMSISIAMIVIGFILMLGDSSSTEEFNPDIFSSRRIIVGPTISFLGFIFMAVSILFRKKK